MAKLLVLTVTVKQNGSVGAAISRNMAASLRISAKSLGKNQRSKIINKSCSKYRALPSSLTQALLTATASHYSPVCSCWRQKGVVMWVKEKTHAAGRVGSPSLGKV